MEEELPTCKGLLLKGKPILRRRGGDSSRVAGLHVDVCQIQSSADAFAGMAPCRGGHK